ncbi:MAG TPA: SRPBCC family protein [Rhizomicrobium sp.]|nr:SRPBCC family protein [Rhizomicrobium sp.]
MASIRKEFPLNAGADEVWDALGDFGAVHQRLAPGFVIDTKLDGDARIVTFANGTSAREVFVARDDENRRLVYTIASERLTHHNASAQVVAESGGTCRFIWTTDLLPDEIAPYISAQLELGVAAMKKTFGG